MSLTFGDRRTNSTSIQPGDLFRRWRGQHHSETATVVDLRPDAFGIPHVRFTLAFEGRETGRFDAGLRTLSLRSFVDAYRERVS